MLSKYDIDYIISCLKRGDKIPEEYKHALFPINKKEYELVYAGKMRKEDILSDTDELANVPLQIERVYNGEEYPSVASDWKNLLIFGDNLQVLKTIYYNNDPIIKDSVKGKVKLVYIDPPFGTGDEYDGNKGQSGYSAKRKGADFVEFLRRRLILLREIMAEDGVIFVRLDYHFGHYIKVIMDEIFGKNNFRNDITINRFKRQLRDLNQFNHATDILYFYSKNDNYRFEEILISRICSFCGAKKDPEWRGMHSPGLRNPPERVICGKCYLPPKGRHWSYTQDKINTFAKNKRIRIDESTAYTNINGEKIFGIPEYLQDDVIPVDSNWTDLKGYVFASTYPTENPEELLKRVIECCTIEGDLVLDCFAGSGTTLAVAEKMGRRWIGCDIGKLSIYTIQKRFLEIANSKDINNHKKKYKKSATAFSVINAGLYDLGKVFSLSEDKYKDFVMNLFDISDIKRKSINGITVDGEKRGFFVKIYPYWDEELRSADIDEEYIKNLHKHIGNRVKERFYIVAPANNVAFINDYYEIDDIRYYFLKIPYQVIHELHNTDFKKIRQPQSTTQINDLSEAIGFHFKRPLEIKSSLKKINDQYFVAITKFMSDYVIDEDGEELSNFESLSMVLVDDNPSMKNENEFLMSNYYFAKDLLKLTNKNANVDGRKTLAETRHILVPVNPKNKNIRVIYVDIYGNEFSENFALEG